MPSAAASLRDAERDADADGFAAPGGAMPELRGLAELRVDMRDSVQQEWRKVSGLLAIVQALERASSSGLD